MLPSVTGTQWVIYKEEGSINLLIMIVMSHSPSPSSLPFHSFLSPPFLFPSLPPSLFSSSFFPLSLKLPDSGSFNLNHFRVLAHLSPWGRSGHWSRSSLASFPFYIPISLLGFCQWTWRPYFLLWPARSFQICLLLGYFCSFLAHLEDLAVSHITLGALKSSFRPCCLQFPPSHPRPLLHWIGFLLESS